MNQATEGSSLVPTNAIEWVTLYVQVEGTASEPEDESVPGFYMLEVDAALDPGDWATAVLDKWHEKNGVEVIDDFVFTVLDASGMEIPASGEDSCTLGDRAEYEGTINECDLPFAVTPAPAP